MRALPILALALRADPCGLHEHDHHQRRPRLRRRLRPAARDQGAGVDLRRTGQAAVRPGESALGPGARKLRRLFQGLPRRGRATARDRADLAGDAAQPQPQLGPPGARSTSSNGSRPRPRGSRAGPGSTSAIISQPRGGPMSSGHASHQIGLDADIWMLPPIAAQPHRDRAREPVVDLDAARQRRLRQRELDDGASWRSSRPPPPTRPWRGSSSSPAPRCRCARTRPATGLAAQGAALVGASLPFPRPPRLPRRRPDLCRPGAAAAGRRLQGRRGLGRPDPQPAAARPERQARAAEAADHAGRPAAPVQLGATSELTVTRHALTPRAHGA